MKEVPIEYSLHQVVNYWSLEMEHQVNWNYLIHSLNQKLIQQKLAMLNIFNIMINIL